MLMKFFKIRVRAALFLFVLLLFTACTKQVPDIPAENVSEEAPAQSTFEESRELESENPGLEIKPDDSDKTAAEITEKTEMAENETKTIIPTGDTKTENKTEIETETEIEAENKTEIKRTTITLDDIKPDSFVYPDEPITPESLSYIVNGALEKHMAEEIIEEDPDPPPHICEILLFDIDFDNFPEIVFKDMKDNRELNTNKVYSLKKDNFGEFLCDFEAWGRDVDTRFYAKEEKDRKRFIARSTVLYNLDFGSSSVSEILKVDGVFSFVDIYRDTWINYYDKDGIKSRISKINGIEFTFDEYQKDLEKFVADLTELPVAETKIEYNYKVLSNSPLKLSPRLIYSYKPDSVEQYAIYEEYLSKIKNGVDGN
jgi:hypothetical protein